MNINENIMNFNKSSGNIINKKTKIKLNINEITKNMNKNKIQKKIEIKNNSKEEEDDTFQKQESFNELSEKAQKKQKMDHFS